VQVAVAGGQTRRERRLWLRDANAERARTIVRRTSLGHAAVNAELNRLAGLQRITEATLEQLEARLRVADKWLDRI
jgi:hypothetical protein